MNYLASHNRHLMAVWNSRAAACVLCLAIGISPVRSSGQTEPAVPPSSGAPGEAAFQNESDLVSYCEKLASMPEHAAALAKTCEFALSRRKSLPDVLCDRTMKRSWTEYGSSSLGVYEIGHSDVVTAKVRYTNGEEQYEDVRINGKTVDPSAPQLTGTWSGGEFAEILSSIFLPSAKTAFRFEKEAVLHSQKVLLFGYRVEPENNKSYVLRVDQTSWYPAYSGRFWVDASTFNLMGLERGTPYMTTQPMRRMTTTIDYADLLLGDGTRMVLPTHSEVLICMPPPLASLHDTCAHHSITFSNWRKFRGTAKVLPDSAK